MTEQLEMSGIPAPARPVIDDKIRETAAKLIAQRLIDEGDMSGEDVDELTSDITQASEYCSDGYEIGKKLDDSYGWDCMSASIVVILDDLYHHQREALRKSENEWAEKYDIQPPIPIGSRVSLETGKTGTITGVYSHGGAKYLVAIDGDPRAFGPEGSRQIVDFEDCQVIDKTVESAVSEEKP